MLETLVLQINMCYRHQVIHYIILYSFLVVNSMIHISTPLRVLPKARQIVRESHEQCHVDKRLEECLLGGFYMIGPWVNGFVKMPRACAYKTYMQFLHVSSKTL